jgi:hypothetical protein
LGFLFWKKTVPRVVAQEIYATDVKANCACNPCWKHLRGALGDNLPKRDVNIVRGDIPFFLDNAATSYDANGFSVVGIYEGVVGIGPELDAKGNVVWGQAPFEAVLWHEAIGHGYLYPNLDHPDTPSNHAGGGGKDQVIAEENLARNCLRLQGATINDRAPTYHGWTRPKP